MITRRVFLTATTASLAGLRPALADEAPHSLKPARTNFLTFQPQFVNTFKSPTPGLTFSSLYNLEAPFDWIRLVYRNDIRDDATIDGAVIAPTSMAGDGFTPCNADGKPDPSLWKRVTFSGGNPDTRPREAAGRGSETAELPGDASWGKNPGPSTFSEWIPVQSLNRNDGGKGALLLVRTFSRGQFRNQFARYQKIGGDGVGRLYAGFESPGDGTKAPWPFSAQPSEIPAAHAIQYRSTIPGASVMFAGDSILAPPYTFGIGLRACALASTPQLPVSIINQAWLGAKTEQFFFLARRELERSRPQILVLQLWSGNDAVITDDTTDAAFSQAMDLVSLGLKRQCAPILVTTPPVPHFPVQEPFRQRSNAQIRAAAASKGFALLDLDKLWASETAPTTFRAGYTRDQMHGTEIACDAAARALAPLIRGLLT